MVRVGLLLLSILSVPEFASAGSSGRDCPFCEHEMEPAKAPDPWTRAFSCPACSGVVHMFSDGTESGRVYRNGRRQVFVIDPHAVSRPSQPVQRPDHAVNRPAHPVQRSNRPVSRTAHPVKRTAHAVRRSNHAVDRTTHAVRRPGHAVGRSSHAVVRPGHAMSRPSHSLGRSTRGIRKPMYVEKRVRAKPRTYAKPHRRGTATRKYANAYRR